MGQTPSATMSSEDMEPFIFQRCPEGITVKAVVLSLFSYLRRVRRIAMFVPEASTSVQKLVAWITGKRAEFVDPRIVTSAIGRHVTRVRSQGFVNVTMNVVLKDLKKYGYDVIPSSIARISEFPLPNSLKSISDQPTTGAESTAPQNQSASPKKEHKDVKAEQPSSSTGIPSIPRPLPMPRRRSILAEEQQVVEELEADEGSSNA